MYQYEDCPFKDKYCKYVCKAQDNRLICFLHNDKFNELCFYSSLVTKEE